MADNKVKTSLKRKINQSDLRRLMKERNENFQSSEKNIESPLAKYDSTGKLSCIACNEVIKSGSLWRHHILSKNHKKNINEKLKRKNTEPISSQSQILKKEKVEISSGHSRTALRVDKEQEVNNGARLNSNSTKADVNLIQGYSSSEEEEEGGDEIQSISKLNASQAGIPNTLPSDFFDSPDPANKIPVPAKITPATSSGTVSSQNSSDVKKAATVPEVIPEGFFDDPVLDAQARNVEYKDPMEEEWAKFKITMAEETNVSQSIMEEDIEQSVVEREITETEERMFYLSKVIALQSKAGERKLPESQQTAKQEDGSANKNSDSEEDEERLLEELLDWRAKKVW